MTRLRPSRWWLLFLLIPLAAGVARLRFDVDILNLLPGDLPVVAGLKTQQKHFSNSRELLIFVEANDAAATETAARSISQELRKRPELVATVHWQPPWQERPDLSTELVAWLWLNQPPAVFGALTNRLAETNLPIVLAEAREELASSFSPSSLVQRGYDPYALLRLPEEATSGALGGGDADQMFVSKSGQARLIFIEAAFPVSNYRVAEKWLADVRSVAERAIATSGTPVRLSYTGAPAFVSEIARGMEKDLAGPSGGTLLVIAALFYFMHRRWIPLIWLILILAVSLGATLAIGGLIFETINVVSLGFATILLGLAEDFGIVIYQERRSHPEWNRAQLFKAAAPGVFWSAVTTAAAFALLGLSSLPGLARLGMLVAIGIVVAALLMLFVYLPLILRQQETAGHESNLPATPHQRSSSHRRRLLLGGVVIFIATAAAVTRWPEFDNSPDALRPKRSAAYETLDKIRLNFSQREDPLWLIVQGRDAPSVAERLSIAKTALTDAQNAGNIESFQLPTTLWPDHGNQISNRTTASLLASRRDLLVSEAERGGFQNNATALTTNLLNIWRLAGSLPPNVLYLPTNANSLWLMGRVTSFTPTNQFALGLINLPSTNVSSFATAFRSSVKDSGITLSGWPLLGRDISERIFSELPWISLPILGIVLISLGLAFRDLREVMLSVAVLVVSGLFLVAVMALLCWKWNMMNLMAIPLLLGLAVDFTIHMQMALRRSQGDLLYIRRSISRALLLAGSTTIAGFASLWFSSNAGLASLGQVCAIGITCALLTTVYFLPGWWIVIHHRQNVVPREK